MAAHHKLSLLFLLCICLTPLCSCSANKIETYNYSLEELQRRRESETLTTLVGEKVVVSGQVTRVYRSKDSRQGFFTIQDGNCAMFGEFSQDIQSTSIIRQNANITVHAIFYDLYSFNDLSLAIYTGDSYVEKSNIEYPVNYFNENTPRSLLLRYFGCMFKIDLCHTQASPCLMAGGSNVGIITKPFYFINFRIQLFSALDDNDIYYFNINVWQGDVIHYCAPLLIKDYGDYVLVTSINLFDLLP